MKRLFIALDLADESRGQLSLLPGDLPGALWVEPDQLHLTLKFLGEASPARQDAVQRALARIIHPSFHLHPQGLGIFPLRGEPETLWIGIKPNPRLEALQHRIEADLARAGIPREKRRFHPHITVARLQEGPPERLAQFLAEKALFPFETLPIQSFSLYSSERALGGPIYTREESFTLEGLLMAPEDQDQDDDVDKDGSPALK